MNAERLEMMQMASGYWVSKMLYCVARLNIADELASGPKTPKQLAAATECHEESLYRVLRALASLGIFAESEDGRFGLTPKAEYLRNDNPETVRDITYMLNDALFDVWGDIFHSVKTGEGAVQKRLGSDMFTAVFSKDPAAAATFDKAMEQIHGPEIGLMLEFFDWSRFSRIADIGGGSGQTLLAIVNKHPNAKGILFDLPSVVERAKANNPGLSRCEVIGGSFFEKVPSGADCYYLRHIVHDWNDADTLKILQVCREAMAPSASLLIVEKAIPRGNAPEFAKILDINMLAIGGKERTLAQYEALFTQAGLALHQHHRTPGPIDLIEARRTGS